MWIRVVKQRKKAPRVGSWHDWKEFLATEGCYRCVYCGVSEMQFGGTRNFHVEHFRPKSKFPKLSNDYNNLFYACCICNALKGSDWPGEPSGDDVAAFPDLLARDLNDLFTCDNGGRLAARCNSAKYLQTRVYLNRPQLIVERRLQQLLAACDNIVYRAREVMDKLDSSEVKSFADALLGIHEARSRIDSSRPYAPSGAMRETKTKPAKKRPKPNRRN